MLDILGMQKSHTADCSTSARTNRVSADNGRAATSTKGCFTTNSDAMNNCGTVITRENQKVRKSRGTHSNDTLTFEELNYAQQASSITAQINVLGKAMIAHERKAVRESKDAAKLRMRFIAQVQRMLKKVENQKMETGKTRTKKTVIAVFLLFCCSTATVSFAQETPLPKKAKLEVKEYPNSVIAIGYVYKKQNAYPYISLKSVSLQIRNKI